MKNMHHSEIILYLLVLFHVGLGVLLSFINPDYFTQHYVIEDGILEWLGFDALLLAGIVSFYRLRLWRKRPLTFSVGVLLTALVFTFGAGEEISYGQRLFNFASPAFFKEHNKQGEFNIHNLRFKKADQSKKEFSVNKVVFGLGLSIFLAVYLIASPFLYRHSRRAKELADRWGIPIPEPFHALFFLILFGLTAMVDSSRKGEIMEFGGAWIAFLLVLYPQNEDIFTSSPEV